MAREQSFFADPKGGVASKPNLILNLNFAWLKINQNAIMIVFGLSAEIGMVFNLELYRQKYIFEAR